STFGGNPLACAAGLATIEAIRDEGLLAASVALGERLRAGIEALGSDQVREVRGVGLMTGIDLRGRVTPVLRGLQERGVLALPAGSLTLRMLPPLVITEAQIDRVVEALGETLAATAKRGRR
ncbi:MAG TPA: aminotransferase class III-fold pyridoxal phosphate-dependent enzyme, partial [Thermomicrobiales bacterium]|nr:aminotransferase class III-fold pyridoxal phosphate-dependent enzyme [Thermomicrobiales bacterium]